MKKTMFKNRRNYKNNPTEFNWNKFKNSRLIYFHQIRSNKEQCWNEFLQNAKNKKIFYAYKYIKIQSIEKLSSIMHDNKMHVDFSNKCDVFIKAVYLKFTLNEKNEDSNTWNENTDWSKITTNKIANTINSFNLKKTCGPNGLNFHIIQKIYKIISELFNLIFQKSLLHGQHSDCWKISLRAIIKKPNKNDYTLLKFYRIISLLNCMKKISKK